MDIWVLSQNKKWFGKMGEMYVAKDDNGEYAIVHSGGAILGYYDSEERCIDIINDFKECIVHLADKENLIVLNMPKE